MATEALIISLGDIDENTGTVAVTVWRNINNKREDIFNNVIILVTPELIAALQKYRRSYDQFGSAFLGLVIPDDMITNPPSEATSIINNFENLREEFKKWLNQNNNPNNPNNIQSIKDTLINNLKKARSVFVESNDINFKMMPWEETLNEFKDLRHITVTMSNPQGNYNNVNFNAFNFPLQVLVILSINVQSDNIIPKKLYGAKIHLLPNPTFQELNQKIENLEHIDIIVFIGHSRTTDNRALIELRPGISRTIEQLREPLENAVNKEVKLALFVSCDGLGIIQELNRLSLSIPFVIVHREPVHIKAAQMFLIEVLKNFVNKGYSLDQSVRRAKRVLYGDHEMDPYPNAPYLPLLFSHPSAEPLVFFWGKILFYLGRLWKKIISILKNKIFQSCALFVVLICMSFAATIYNNNNSQKPSEPVVITTPTSSPTSKQKLPSEKIQIPKIIQDFCKLGDLSPNNDNALSCGERSLLDERIDNNNKQEGMNMLLKNSFDSNDDLKKVQKYFEQAFSDDNNPETLIFKNNAEILANTNLTDKDILPIAIALNLSSQDNPAYKTNMLTLQGIAYFQDKYNHNPDNSKNEKKIFLLLANDIKKQNKTITDNEISNCKLNSQTDNRKSMCYGIKIANQIAERKPYAIIGHYSSRMTFYALTVYQTAHIPLMAFSATASNYTPKKEKEKEKEKPKQETISLQKQPYFFRVVSTTKDSARKLADYLNDLKTPTIKNVVSVKSNKLFSNSFDQEFNLAWKVKEDKTIENITLGNKQQTIEDIENILKNQNAKDTAIVLCPDAFTNEEDDPERKKTESIIQKANQYQLIIGGCNVVAVYPKAVENTNIVVAVPWSPYSQNQSSSILSDLKEHWNKKDDNFDQKNHEAFMRRALGYDAIKVLTDALTALESDLPLKDGSKLQIHLANNKFQGITGEISFDGSDRAEDTTVLITPNCSSSEKCEDWKLAE